MRKWKTVLSLFMMLFLFSTIGHAASNKTIHVSMNGGNVSVTQVPIIKDGEVVDMIIPSFVYIDRTLVPLRFVAESYGAKVEWNQKTQTATVFHGKKEINLTINSDVATLNNEKKLLDKNSIPKLVTFANQDTRTMVPLAFMSEMLGYEVGWDSKANAAYINSKKEVEPEPEKEVDKPDDEAKIDLSSKVISITKEFIDGKEAIVVQGTKEIQAKMMKLKNPERIVVDLLDSTLQGTTLNTYDYNLEFIKGVRTSQFIPDNNNKPDDKIVRIVLDIKDGVLDPNVKIQTYGDKIVITPEKDFWENMSYNTEGKDRIFTINNLVETSYLVKYDSMTKSMEITIPKDSVALIEGISSIKDGLVEEIKVVEGSIDTKVFIQFKRSIEYTLLSNEMDSEIKLQIKRDSNITTSDRLIVIDAGHGGTDPGSISPNQVKEKDINFEISLKTEKALRDLGYNVLMTRDTDKKIDLYERPGIANRNFADIFVSIHGNSTTNKDVHGIEVLYAPSTTGSEKEEGQLRLAKAVLDELIKATGAIDRGVKDRPNLVVIKESKMPAILIEVGFLSNANEEKLITSESYQDKIVAAIIKGIENYFGTY